MVIASGDGPLKHRIPLSPYMMDQFVEMGHALVAQQPRQARIPRRGVIASRIQHICEMPKTS